jgi:aminomethyltransferase
MKKPVGMAYVATPYNKVDSEIYINVRGRLLKAKVVKTPFYKK